MRPTNCLRLARQASGVSPLLCSSAPAALRRGEGLAAVPVRALSTAPDTPPKISRFASEPGVGRHHVSSFRQHREEELREDQESEDPLYPDAYPRLESSANRRSIPEFLRDFNEMLSGGDVTLTGRVRSKRAIGRYLIFLDIVNEFQKVQVMIVRKHVTDCPRRRQKFSLFKNLIQCGDHISVTGIATRTSSGEPTLEARDFPKLLSPSMEQIPEKLTDPKTRMQERHVDMLVNRRAVDILRLRAEITKHMRLHFQSKRFLEFQTPILAENAGGAVARPFVTRATEFRNKNLALRIAPELWLKRLVVGGVDRVFEIGPAFRNEGVDATHNPEFTMCEFYSAYTNLSDLIGETEELLYSLAKHSHELIATQLTSLPPVDLSLFARPFKQVQFIPALEEAMGIRLPKLTVDDALPEMLAVLKLAGIRIPGEVPDSLPKLLDRLAAMYLEPRSFNEPLFIINHPACMSPLAKAFLCPRTYQLVSARAELFVGGRELANMYEEENDPEEQKRKLIAHRNLVNKPGGEVGYQEETAEGAAADTPLDEEAAADTPPDEEAAADAAPDEDEWQASPLDQTYVDALNYALPPTGGWGCGVDRLVMLFSGASRISDCLSFGTLRNVVGLSADDKATRTDEAASTKKRV